MVERPLKKTGLLFRLKRDIRNNYSLYLMILPAFFLIVLFCYVPMYGLALAFKDYSAILGIWESPSVGFDNFARFFRGAYFGEVLWNTFSISLYSLVLGFPLPVIFALMLNSVGNRRFKKSLQMVSYAPYFISVVVVVAMLEAFLDVDSGIINRLVVALGGKSVDYMSSPGYFKTIFVLSGIWQGLGWNSIIYIASLSGVPVTLYDAADIEGASKLQKIRYIDLPFLVPTMIVLLILSTGNILSVGFEKIYLMQNDLNASASEVIST
ncbi:MAG: ABC transporter permease, partial [Christensenellales bacterium]